MTERFKIKFDLSKWNDEEFLALKQAVYEEAMHRADIAEAKQHALQYAGQPIRQPRPDDGGEW
jgi:hypothetical protein